MNDSLVWSKFCHVLFWQSHLNSPYDGTPASVGERVIRVILSGGLHGGRAKVPLSGNPTVGWIWQVNDRSYKRIDI